MTPARKKALQYIHSQGEVSCVWEYPLSAQMVAKMVSDGQAINDGWITLTDKGRRALNGEE